MLPGVILGRGRRKLRPIRPSGCTIGLGASGIGKLPGFIRISSGLLLLRRFDRLLRFGQLVLRSRVLRGGIIGLRCLPLWRPDGS